MTLQFDAVNKKYSEFEKEYISLSKRVNSGELDQNDNRYKMCDKMRLEQSVAINELSNVETDMRDNAAKFYNKAASKGCHIGIIGLAARELLFGKALLGRELMLIKCSCKGIGYAFPLFCSESNELYARYIYNITLGGWLFQLDFPNYNINYIKFSEKDVLNQLLNSVATLLSSEIHAFVFWNEHDADDNDFWRAKSCFMELTRRVWDTGEFDYDMLKKTNDFVLAHLRDNPDDKKAILLSAMLIPHLGMLELKWETSNSKAREEYKMLSENKVRDLIKEYLGKEKFENALANYFRDMALEFRDDEERKTLFENEAHELINDYLDNPAYLDIFYDSLLQASQHFQN
ncbi:hypothetical protein FACS1894113_1700 [Alphaproteobacteria bacterium]|nr:hypothetical protein FACS1894113_1700 [Alphaproteobacteria bacterium]